jgi:hypothetical protein
VAEPQIPAKLRVVTCSTCGEYIGIEDVARIQHEHMDADAGWPVKGKCRNGRYVYTEYVASPTPEGGER